MADNPRGLAHLHAQESPHDEAYLIADRAALFEIMRAIGEALGTGNPAMATLYTADGEGFDLVVVKEDAAMGTGWWQEGALPYSDEEYMGDGSKPDPWEHPAVRPMAEHKKEQS